VLAPSLVVAAGVEIKKEKPTNAANRFWYHEAEGKQYFVIQAAKFSPSFAANVNKALTLLVPDAFDNITQDTQDIEPYAFVACGDDKLTPEKSDDLLKIVSNTGKDLKIQTGSRLKERYDRKLYHLNSAESLGRVLAQAMPNATLTEGTRRGKEKTVDAATLKRYSDMARKPQKFVKEMGAAFTVIEDGDVKTWIFGIEGKIKPAQLSKVILRLGGTEAEMQEYNYYPDLKKLLLLDRYGPSR
jgi:hypothetical protein